MSEMFSKATKKQGRLRMAISGPSGSGKTYTSLRLAKALGGKVAVIDSERGSAAKYADEFDFAVLELDSYDPRRYIEAIRAAEREGFDVLIIDSLSHAWAGKDGALEMVDKAAARSRDNKFAAWREVTPVQNELVDAMLHSKCHVIATMRSKSEWVLEENERGKKVPKKIGMAPVQRDQIEYEFDVFGEMDAAKMVVTKTRCKALRDAVINEPGDQLAATLKAWLSDGAPAPAPSLPQSNGQSDGERVAFGPHKGMAILHLTSSMLDDCIQLATEKLNSTEAKGAKWADALQMNLAALQAEQASRRVAEHPRDSSELVGGNP